MDIIKAAYLAKWQGVRVKRKVLKMAGRVPNNPRSYIGRTILIE